MKLENLMITMITDITVGTYFGLGLLGFVLFVAFMVLSSIISKDWSDILDTEVRYVLLLVIAFTVVGPIALLLSILLGLFILILSTAEAINYSYWYNHSTLVRRVKDIYSSRLGDLIKKKPTMGNDKPDTIL